MLGEARTWRQCPLTAGLEVPPEIDATLVDITDWNCGGAEPEFATFAIPWDNPDPGKHKAWLLVFNPDQQESYSKTRYAVHVFGGDGHGIELLQTNSAAEALEKLNSALGITIRSPQLHLDLEESQQGRLGLDDEPQWKDVRRIVSIGTRHINDDISGIDNLGEYTDSPQTEFAINRIERGDWSRGEYQYFEPTNPDPAHHEYAEADYRRAESYNRGYWHYIGVVATATIEVEKPNGEVEVEKIRTPGLWGVENDSDHDYLIEIATEEMNALKRDLKDMGFSDAEIEDAVTNRLEESLRETGEADQDYNHDVFNRICNEIKAAGFRCFHREFDKYQGVYINVTAGRNLKFWIEEWETCGDCQHLCLYEQDDPGFLVDVYVWPDAVDADALVRYCSDHTPNYAELKALMDKERREADVFGGRDQARLKLDEGSLDDEAREMVGDGGWPNIYWVSVSTEVQFYNHRQDCFDFGIAPGSDIKMKSEMLAKFDDCDAAIAYARSIELSLKNWSRIVIEDRLSGVVFERFLQIRYDVEEIDNTHYSREEIRRRPLKVFRGKKQASFNLDESHDRPPVIPLNLLAKHLGVDPPTTPRDVWPEFALWLCGELLKLKTSDDVRQAITGVRDLYHQWVQGDWPGRPAFRAAANAAARAGVSKAAMATRLQDFLRSPQLHLNLEESRRDDVISAFLRREFRNSDSWGVYNLRISKKLNGHALVSHATPVAFWIGDAPPLHLNTDTYSMTTTRLQGELGSGARNLGIDVVETGETGLRDLIDDADLDSDSRRWQSEMENRINTGRYLGLHQPLPYRLDRNPNAKMMVGLGGQIQKAAEKYDNDHIWYVADCIRNGRVPNDADVVDAYNALQNIANENPREATKLVSMARRLVALFGVPGVKRGGKPKQLKLDLGESKNWIHIGAKLAVRQGCDCWVSGVIVGSMDYAFTIQAPAGMEFVVVDESYEDEWILGAVYKGLNFQATFLTEDIERVMEPVKEAWQQQQLDLEESLRESQEAWVYKSDLLCDSCARDAVMALRRDGIVDTGDSDYFPQGPHSDCGGEADCPQHCGSCRKPLENSLTADGVDYAVAQLTGEISRWRKSKTNAMKSWDRVISDGSYYDGCRRIDILRDWAFRLRSHVITLEDRIIVDEFLDITAAPDRPQQLRLDLDEGLDSKTERWVFTDDELELPPEKINRLRGSDEFLAWPYLNEVPLTDVGVVVLRNGTTTHRLGDGTIGIPGSLCVAADQEDSLTTIDNAEIADTWRDVWVTSGDYFAGFVRATPQQLHLDLEESQDRPPVVPLDDLAKHLGVDLPTNPKDVWPEFALWLCDELLKTETSDDVRQAITGVRDLYHQWVQGDWPGRPAFRAAANAAARAGVSKAAMATRLQNLLRSPQLHLDLEESQQGRLGLDDEPQWKNSPELQNILDSYDVDDGIICSPGKFEGESLWAPYFWEFSGEMPEIYFGDEHSVYHTVVCNGDIVSFPELDGVYGIFIWEDETGFVHCDTESSKDRYDYRVSQLEISAIESMGPQEDDWVTDDYHVFRRGRHVVRVSDNQDWRQVLTQRMDADGFHPNVWHVSDHGNAVLLDVGSD